MQNTHYVQAILQLFVSLQSINVCFTHNQTHLTKIMPISYVSYSSYFREIRANVVSALITKFGYFFYENGCIDISIVISTKQGFIQKNSNFVSFLYKLQKTNVLWVRDPDLTHFSNMSISICKSA
jgi:hypothetical protein